MANRGLKPYVKNIEVGLSNKSQGFVNISDYDANLMLNYTLFEGKLPEKHSFGLIYNFIDRNDTGLFGKGFKLNLYREITLSGNKYLVKNADGSTDVYEYISSNTYKNNETKIQLIITVENSITYHKFVDVDGYELYFNLSLSSNYPVKLVKNNSVRTEYNFYSVNKFIKIVDDNHKILFTLDSLNRINGIDYNHDFMNESYTITYNNSYIDTIIYKVNSTTISTLSFEFGSNYITVDDETKRKRTRFNFTYNKVSTIVETKYDSSSSSSSTTSFVYNHGYTKVIDYLDNEICYFYAENGKFMFEMEDNEYTSNGATYHNYNFVNTYYNDDGLLEHVSSNIRCNPDNTSILSSKRINGFSLNGVSISDYYPSSDGVKYSYILGSVADAVCGTGTATKTVSINGVKGDNYLLVVFVKENQLEPDSNNPFTLTVHYGNNMKTTALRKKEWDSEYELVTIGFHLETSVSNITITMNFDEVDGVVVGGLQLIKKDFGVNYFYNNSNELIGIEDCEGKTTYAYNVNHLLSNVTYPNLTSVNYVYTFLANDYYLTKKEDNTGLKEEYTYINDVIAPEVTRLSYPNLLPIVTKCTYDNGFLKEEFDELGYKTEYEYTSSLLSKTHYYLSQNPTDDIMIYLTRESFDVTLVDTIKRECNGNYVKSKYSYTVDKEIGDVENNSTNTPVSIISYFRNINGYLCGADYYDTSILGISYVYDNIQLPITINYGGNEHFVFEYDEYHGYRLDYIKYYNGSNTKNKYHFTYNNYGLLDEVFIYPYNNSVMTSLKKYYYDDEERVKRITSAYLNYTYEYIYDNSYLTIKKLNINNNSKYFSYSNEDKNTSTTLHTINQSILNMFDIIPLNGSIKSIKGVSPRIFDVNQNTKAFIHNDNVGKSLFYPMNSKLVYRINTSESLTLMANIIPNNTSSKQYIFSLYDGDNNIDLYIYSNTLYLDVNGNVSNTNLTVYNIDKSVGLTFERRMNGDYPTEYIDLMVFYNGYTFTTYKEADDVFSLDLFLGCSNSYNYKFSGYIYNLAYSLVGSNVQTMFQLEQAITDNVITYNLDNLNRISQKVLKHGVSQILKHGYTYKNVTVDNESRTTHLIQSETMEYGINNVSRSYAYDDMNRIISITDNVFGSHSYTYDYRGFLITETYGNITKTYQYDNNGNIISVTSSNYPNNPDVLLYDSTIKDRLIKYNNQNVFYSNDSPGNISYSGDFSYTYEGKRLTVVYYANSGEYRNTTFTYDEEGLIIKRNVYGWNHDDDDDWEEDTFYYYENGNLVCEINDYIRNDYLYDNNGNLYGFIQNNTNIYYYIRDILGNILGIVNDSGVLVAKYDYDAYGNILSSTGNIYNPFRYKGYYYDSGIELYYLKSRFYSPFFKRFLTPDNINYLDVNNAGCINLYAYCNNNPVMYSDPEGHFIISLLGYLLFEASIAIPTGFATQIAASTIVYASAVITSSFRTNVRNDMISIGYNPFNTNMEAVYNSKTISFYKGVPIIRISSNRSGTFLAIFLEENAKNKDPEILNHEYGHIIQQCFLGPVKYLMGIGLPSATSPIKGGNLYYKQLWESSADYFGSVPNADVHKKDNSLTLYGLMYFIALLFR